MDGLFPNAIFFSQYTKANALFQLGLNVSDVGFCELATCVIAILQ